MVLVVLRTLTLCAIAAMLTFSPRRPSTARREPEQPALQKIPALIRGPRPGSLLRPAPRRSRKLPGVSFNRPGERFIDRWGRYGAAWQGDACGMAGLPRHASAAYIDSMQERS